MITKRYEIAGVGFTVTTPEPYADCPPYAQFLKADGPVAAEYRFRRVDVLPASDGKCIRRGDFQQVWLKDDGVMRYLGPGEGRPPYICARFGEEQLVSVSMAPEAPEIWGGFVFNCLGLEHLLARHDRAILHCSYIDIGGSAVLFTAPSGTGKSTQAELWRVHRGARVINGDRACISADDIPMAHGLPMAGTSNICYDQSLPLRAIVSLEQGPKNELERLKPPQALGALYSGCWVNTWDRRDVDRILALMGRMIAQVPVYRLRCVPDETAVDALASAIL